MLYNCSIENSSTIKSILDTIIDCTDVKLLIWNNGGNILEIEDINKYILDCKTKNISTEIYQDVRNLSLSKIYNYFINKKDYDFISIFDQDTYIEKSFIKNIKNNVKYDLICPEVYLSNKENVKSSPVYNKGKINTDFVESGDFNARAIFTCASGITFSSRLVKIIIDKYGFVFDEKYAFYWADHDLFERLCAFDFIKGLCIGNISHDMSGVGNDFDKMKESAKLEHGYGQILRRIYNDNKSGLLQNFIYAVKYSVRSKCSIRASMKIIQCALLKSHPRSKNEVNKKIKPARQIIMKTKK
ncbi:glycosyl transferase [Pectobacterium aroidearum]|uniref:glycosyl transferase n=1 Tax=Pectobacterium aroidearum TaxID=1201031 RepID=UPI002113EC7E|nr:glycosyl transferase [Pectobacterium aroidearum]UUE57544.1 glycosyl transferase [Pectobacterium aroidearum]UUE70249.1 glycosyl transferase [Pectobacterium aroidearum]UUE74627.1 glycosyl transferase [Pectobacterium aroidearum]UUE78957.1 glycosyl transferase [Pectobacterium aroidearum]